MLDSQATLASESQLVRTARDVPVVVAVADGSPRAERERLTKAGCEVLVCPGGSANERLGWFLDELGRRRLTNVLVEGGSQLLGSLHDAGQIDEVHVFIAPRIIGGDKATPAIGALGVERLALATMLDRPRIEPSGDDVYIHGRVRRESNG